MKTCTKCHVEQPVSSYYGNGHRTKDGLFSWCKGCCKANKKANYWNNPEQVKKQSAEYYLRTKKEHQARGKAYYQANKEMWRKIQLAKFEMSIEDYTAMLSEQGGVCAVCGETDGKRALAVDHDHVSGMVRALLCKGCNLAIGNFKDDPAIMRAGAAYVEAHMESRRLIASNG